MLARTRKAVPRIAPEVLVSVIFHAVLLSGLFLLPGLAESPGEREQSSLLRARQERNDLVEPPPPPPEDIAPPTPEPRDTPRVVDPPPEEFPDLPEDSHAAVPDLSPSDLPWSRNPRPGGVIGIGGGSRGHPTPPPAVVPPPEPGPTTTAVPERKETPSYPRRAVEREFQGRVVLLVEVLPDGSVGKIEVKTSSGHAILDRAAIAAVRKWEFQPAYAQGQPVRSLVEVPINFKLTE